MSDAHYKFILIDVGAKGCCSNSGIFSRSEIRTNLDANTLNVPPPSQVGKYELLYVLVGWGIPIIAIFDAALSKKFSVGFKKNIYNDRRRRTMESVFGCCS